MPYMVTLLSCDCDKHFYDFQLMNISRTNSNQVQKPKWVYLPQRVNAQQESGNAHVKLSSGIPGIHVDIRVLQ